MAVDVCSASEPFISPRISLSHDLNNQLSETSTATNAASNTTTATFDFCIDTKPMQPITSADELFFGGVLLPTQIKKHEFLHPEPESEPEPKAVVSENEIPNTHKQRLKEILSNNDEEQEKSLSTSFWKFMRTTSLNSHNGTGPKRLFRSLSLKRLLRSNSTNSTHSTTRNEATKDVEKSNLQKEPSMLPRCYSSIHSPSVHYNNDNSSRRWSAVKKKAGGGTKVNPVLNITPSYNMNLFGLGSIFCNVKPRNKTK